MINMRQELARIYKPTWVAQKTDAQVLAIFRRLQKNGTIKL